MSKHLKFGFAVQYVTDIEAARRFYVEVLGLDVQRTSPTFIQFPSFAIASDESMTGTRDTELYWLVDDADAAFRELSAGREVSLPLTKKPFGKVFGLKDPSGHPCYVLELSRERPSKPVP